MVALAVDDGRSCCDENDSEEFSDGDAVEEDALDEEENEAAFIAVGSSCLGKTKSTRFVLNLCSDTRSATQESQCDASSNDETECREGSKVCRSRPFRSLGWRMLQ